MTNNLEQIHNDIWAFINEQTESNSPLAVAGVMVTQALTIYKTMLSEEEFDSIMDTISDTRGRIQKITLPELQ